MDFVTEHLHCSDILLASLASEIQELTSVLASQKWAPDFSLTTEKQTLHNQAAYNKSLSISLAKQGWGLQPRLSQSPRLIGDFAKGFVFGERVNPNLS